MCAPGPASPSQLRPGCPGPASFPPGPGALARSGREEGRRGPGGSNGRAVAAATGRGQKNDPGAVQAFSSVPAAARRLPGALCGPQSPGTHRAASWRKSGRSLRQRAARRSRSNPAGRQDSDFAPGFKIVPAEPGTLGRAFCAPPVAVSALNRLPEPPPLPGGAQGRTRASHEVAGPQSGGCPARLGCRTVSASLRCHLGAEACAAGQRGGPVWMEKRGGLPGRDFPVAERSWESGSKGTALRPSSLQRRKTRKTTFGTAALEN
ncbi:spidroin-2-like [Pongo pygmaeus]|uniref:spidroin-2-like n=1 Tax=Pongo pygmaeus TaxID=9600 RepID=UPI0023E2D0FE|nr:spidroin-2-like [Pongo pygmaeus]